MLLLYHLLSARGCVLLAVPKDIDDYVHRIGRTGRAVSPTFSCCVVFSGRSDDCGLCQGNTGHATAFVNDRNYNICRCVHPDICLVLPQLPWLRRWVFLGQGSDEHAEGRKPRRAEMAAEHGHCRRRRVSTDPSIRTRHPAF